MNRLLARALSLGLVGITLTVSASFPVFAHNDDNSDQENNTEKDSTGLSTYSPPFIYHYLETFFGTPRVKTNDILSIPYFIRDAAGGTPATDETPLIESQKGNPILAPDGHQVTLEEFNNVKGKVKAYCDDDGTRVKLYLRGLIPDGVYTIWNATFKAPGWDGTFEGFTTNLLGLGPVGPNNGSQNSLTASSEGRAFLDVTTPEGSLAGSGTTQSFGTIKKCALEEAEWHIAGAYHLDSQTHGPDLGPEGTAVEQFAFILKK
jgi:hypothetical protein